MYNNASNKASKGTVGIESFQGRLRLRLPRQLFEGKQKYLSLGLPDTVVTRRAAKAKAQLIESDIALERFDHSLVKYGKQQPQLTLIQSIQPQSLRVIELWQQFFNSKRPGIKPKTVEKYENLSALFAKVGNLRIEEALEVRHQLEKITTVSRMKDALMYLSAACKWGMKHKLAISNPFEGMAQELPKHRYQSDPKPNAFTAEERDRTIAAFKGDKRKGMNYRHYAPFVEFLFGVGCRPSEAIGLRWKHISEDCRFISFEGSLVQIGNKRIYSEGSKNNRTRKIAVSSKIQSLLHYLRPENCNSESLVFLSPNGDSINYRNFSRRAWSSVVNPIKPDTTPYSCRDTFITAQLLKGAPSAVIAKWCDTSTQMIDKNYADKLQLTQLQPLD